MPEDIFPIIKGKISSLNQAPQSLVLKRLLEAMGLKVSEVEMLSWKNRNIAAHGGEANNPVDLILNSKILITLLHRMLSGATYCSNSYIDYYNFHHISQILSDEIPDRGI